MLTSEQRERLVEAGHRLSVSHWEIGDVVALALEGAEKQSDVLREAGLLCGLSWRRVRKIAYVSMAFPEHIRGEWGFGYYERAMELGEYALDAIEFLDWYKEEYGRALGVTEFIRIFRTHILGDVTMEEPPPFEVGVGDSDEAIGYVQRLRFLLRHNERARVILDELESLVRQEAQARTATPISAYSHRTSSESLPLQ